MRGAALAGRARADFCSSQVPTKIGGCDAAPLRRLIRFHATSSYGTIGPRGKRPAGTGYRAEESCGSLIFPGGAALCGQTRLSRGDHGLPAADRQGPIRYWFLLFCARQGGFACQHGADARTKGGGDQRADPVSLPAARGRCSQVL